MPLTPNSPKYLNYSHEFVPPSSDLSLSYESSSSVDLLTPAFEYSILSSKCPTSSSSSMPIFFDQTLPSLHLEQLDDDYSSSGCLYTNQEFQECKEEPSVLAELEKNTGVESWQLTDPMTWNKENVIHFVYYMALKHNNSFETFRGEAFSDIDGEALCGMGLQQLVDMSPQLGKELHHAIGKLRKKYGVLSLASTSLTPPSMLSPFIPITVEKLAMEPDVKLENSSAYDLTPPYSDEFSTGSLNYQQPVSPDFLQNSSDTWNSPYRVESLKSRPTINHASPVNLTIEMIDCFYPTKQNTPFKLEKQNCSSNYTTAYQECGGLSVQAPVVKQKRGRPKKKRPSTEDELMGVHKNVSLPKSMLLWEFLCDLLKKGEQQQQQQQQLKQNDTNEVDEKEDDDDDDDDDELEKKINCEKAAKFGHVHRGFYKGSKRKAKVVIWENKEEGIFRIVDSKKVAELWGKHKANKKMSFEKFTRALRWCKKESKTMAELPVNTSYPRKCYKFGPKAFNWRQLAFSSEQFETNQPF